MPDLCPLRDRHAPYITPAMKKRGLTLITCPCGLKAAVHQNAKEN